MKQLIAFSKKEFLEVWRTGKFLILFLIFVLFGIMNPAIAKLTPWMMEQFATSLEESGLIVGEVTVNAMTSWTQFYKNVPMGLIIFLLIFSGILATELQKGTLINMLTKGLSRNLVIIAKLLVMIVLWTFNYWSCFFITYSYNEYFWDNDIVNHLYFSAFCVYLFGIWLIALLILISTIVTTTSFVTVGTGVVFFIVYMLSLLPDIKRYFPTKLLDASGVLVEVGKVEDYTVSIWITVIVSMIQLVIAMMVFYKKKL